MNVRDALHYATQVLAPAGVETPRVDAQIILAWVTKQDRAFLAREPEHTLPPREELIFRKSIDLRRLRRPVPYITGESYFYGHRFKINRAVLIPRPETEHLVEAGIAACAGLEKPVIADIGTGSGCVAISLALAVPEATVQSVDISRLALLLARKNVAIHQVQSRVTLIEGDGLYPLFGTRHLDLVVSNPPYIAVHEIAGLQPEVRDYEPHLALAGDGDSVGPDGTAMHGRLLRDAKAVLKPGGWLMMEMGIGQAQAVFRYAEDYGYTEISTIKDYSGTDRVVVARAPQD